MMLNGDAGDDFMRGVDRADTLNGGAGTDWALYDASPTTRRHHRHHRRRRRVRRRSQQATVIGADVENIGATNYDDVPTGSASANYFRANDGNDMLVGLGGNDQLRGRPGRRPARGVAPGRMS